MFYHITHTKTPESAATIAPACRIEAKPHKPKSHGERVTDERQTNATLDDSHPRPSQSLRGGVARDVAVEVGRNGCGERKFGVVRTMGTEHLYIAKETRARKVTTLKTMQYSRVLRPSCSPCVPSRLPRLPASWPPTVGVGRPMRLRCKAFPLKLHAFASSQSHI